jgi:CHASE3 domain sensor protein
LTIGLASACFALLLVAGLTYSTLARNNVDRLWVAHTFIVLEKLGDLQSQIADAETGQRGFLLTGDAGYLEPYQASLTQIPESMLALRRLTSDNPSQQANITRMESHSASSLAPSTGISVRSLSRSATSAS